MGTDLVDQAGLSKRVAALAGNSREWSMERAIELAGGVDLDRTIADYLGGLAPLAATEGLDGKGKLSIAIEDNLAVIATAINPMMSTEQADAWTKAMRAKLGTNISGHVLREATATALGLPFKFFSEVEGKVRELAEAISSRHELAIARLASLKRAMADAARAAAAPRLEPIKRTVEDWRAIRGGFAGKELLGIALTLGNVTQEDFDMIERDFSDDCEHHEAAG